MADDADRVVRRARLDDRAAAVVTDLDDADAALLASAWDGAVAAQDREVEQAIEGSLGMLPKLLRKQVLRILTGALVVLP